MSLPRCNPQVRPSFGSESLAQGSSPGADGACTRGALILAVIIPVLPPPRPALVSLELPLQPRLVLKPPSFLPSAGITSLSHQTFSVIISLTASSTGLWLLGGSGSDSFLFPSVRERLSGSHWSRGGAASGQHLLAGNPPGHWNADMLLASLLVVLPTLTMA